MAYYDRSSFSAFHVKVAETPEEVKELLEVGSEHVCEKTGCCSSGSVSERPKNVQIGEKR